MEQDLQSTISLLARTPAALNALLRDLPDTWTLANEGSKTWNTLDVVAHLIHTEKVNWMLRTKAVLQYGDSRTFDPLVREPSPEENHGKCLAALLDEFARLRSESLQELSALNLETADFAKRGRHPVFGEITLSQLLATWAVHDLTHLHQISRILADQYRQAVGPWSAYLGVLHCNGHSEP